MPLDLALPYLHSPHLDQNVSDADQKVKGEHLHKMFALIYPVKVFQVFTPYKQCRTREHLCEHLYQ